MNIYYCFIFRLRLHRQLCEFHLDQQRCCDLLCHELFHHQTIHVDQQAYLCLRRDDDHLDRLVHFRLYPCHRHHDLRHPVLQDGVHELRGGPACANAGRDRDVRLLRQVLVHRLWHPVRRHLFPDPVVEAIAEGAGGHPLFIQELVRHLGSADTMDHGAIRLEDVHMNIESRLADLIGAPAGRLHTARRRSDEQMIIAQLVLI